jgi:hypothetical protein
MKAEHRKELQTNTLADSLGKIIEGAKHGPSRKTVFIVGAIALAILLFYLWRWFHHSSEEETAKRFADLEALANGEAVDTLARTDKNAANVGAFGGEREREKLELKALADFAEENKGTVPGRMARLRQARLAFHCGLRDLGAQVGHDEAVANIKSAAETYEKLIEEMRDQPHILQEVMLNAARSRETLGEVEPAKKHYERLAKEFPDTLAGQMAKDAAERLTKDPAGVEEVSKALNIRAAAKGGN